MLKKYNRVIKKGKSFLNRLEESSSFVILTLIVGICLVFFGTYLFMSGTHSVDLAFNVYLMAYNYNEDIDNLCDIASDGNCYHYDYVYWLGMNYMKIGYLVTLLGFFFVGIVLVKIEYKLKKGEVHGNFG